MLFGLMTGVLAIIFIIASLKSKEESGKNDEADRYELNKHITNEMSQIPELEKLDKKILNYMKKWDIRGASLAIMRNDSLVYAKGYGWADEELGIPMEPGHILRMASVSKLITATGIMVLQAPEYPTWRS